MSKLTNKYNSLFSSCVEKIEQLIEEKGTESKFQNKLILKVPDEQMFDLDGGRYLIEIDGEQLIDNKGYTYQLHVLTLEQLCEVVDAISGESSDEEISIDVTKEEAKGIRQLINYVIGKRVCNKASDLSYMELINLKNKI